LNLYFLFLCYPLCEITITKMSDSKELKMSIDDDSEEDVVNNKEDTPTIITFEQRVQIVSIFFELNLIVIRTE